MHIVMFYHSLLSDWNHGNAHFLRGMVTELLSRGHRVDVYEPRDAWSLRMLLQTQKTDYRQQLHSIYPGLSSNRYGEDLDLDCALDGVDLVLVHEWNEPWIVNALAKHHRTNRHYRLLFHDTHHRSFSAPGQIRRLDLPLYDGVLAYGESIRQIYLANGWNQNVWTWHEAADVRVFKPMRAPKEIDLIWIGNWGDDERTAQLDEFLIEPAGSLGLKTKVYGVQFGREAIEVLTAHGLDYQGWVPNFFVPRLFARARATVHIPRRFYASHLPGIPTIRPFEAMACGIPLICSPWQDSEHLFHPGQDYLVAQNGSQMRDCLHQVMTNETLSRTLAENGLRTILKRHTCAHRADELMSICLQLGLAALAEPAPEQWLAESTI